MEKKYQIFVSSTYNDLKNERNAVSKAILDLEHIPAGMELFPAFDQEQLGYIEKVIDQCDYYVLLIAGRYGSLDADGISYTEREYDYALKTGKPVLAFVKKSDQKPLLEDSETDKDRLEALERFKAKASSGRLIKFWANEGDLSSAVIVALTKAFREIPQVGWVRADQIADDSAIRRINSLQLRIEEMQREIATNTPSHGIIANLAALDEEFEFEMTYSYGEFTNRKKASKKFRMTWRGIARAILPYINSVTPQSKVSTFVGNHLRASGMDNQPSLHFDDETEVVICVQLEQLGFIERSALRAKAGGMVDCIKATGKGAAFVVEALAVRGNTDTNS